MVMLSQWQPILAFAESIDIGIRNTKQGMYELYSIMYFALILCKEIANSTFKMIISIFTAMLWPNLLAALGN